MLDLAKPCGLISVLTSADFTVETSFGTVVVDFDCKVGVVALAERLDDTRPIVLVDLFDAIDETEASSSPLYLIGVVCKVVGDLDRIFVADIGLLTILLTSLTGVVRKVVALKVFFNTGVLSVINPFPAIGVVTL